MRNARTDTRPSGVRLIAEKFTLWDGLLVAILFAASILPLLASESRQVGTRIDVRVGERAFSFPLGEDAIHSLAGPLGEAQLVVRDGRATLRNAHCPMRVCEAMGAASRPGHVIVCVPNRIVVSVSGQREVDAVSR